jgi:hypothetical protein
MSTLNPRLDDQLDRLVPAAAVEGDWEAIVRSARRRSRRRRLIQLGAIAAAFVLGVSPVGGAIADRAADFSAWLRGEPGAPAAESDQHAFDRSNSRSWAGFPRVTKLRSLIKTTAGGNEFELFGFRSRGSLCLRIVGRGLNESPALSCAPVSELERARAPVVVVQADHGMGLATRMPEGVDFVPVKAQASFGIVADGVKGVELEADDGLHQATVASNAFLSVVDKPTLGTRVRKVFAIDAAGHRTEVPFQAAPFGWWDLLAPAHDRPAGPTQVQRRVVGGTIGWLLRHEERGEEPPKDARFMRGAMPRGFEFARLLTPDPRSHMRVLVAIGPLPRNSASRGGRSLCTYVILGRGAGGGCAPLENPFPRAPFSLGQSINEGGDQYATLSGVASDDVARMELFLATGETRPIPLRDNAWLVQAARAAHPVRVVAYDRDDRIIGIQDIGDTLAQRTRPVGTWRTVLTVPGHRGEPARVRVATSNAGGRCHEIRLPGGGGSNGCRPKAGVSDQPKMGVGISAGRDGAWVTGQVSEDIARVDIVSRTGKIETVEPTAGFILSPLGEGTSVESNGLSKIVARDASGRQVAVYRHWR